MFTVSEIPLASIDWPASQQSFGLRMGRDSDALRESIRTCGQIAPITVRDTLLVCGFGRVEALRELGQGTIAARLLPADTPDLDCLLMAIHDNAQGRGFNTAEAAAALAKTRNAGCPALRLRHEVAPLLGLPRSDKVVAQHLDIAALGDAVMDALAHGSIQREHALALLELDEPDRAWFAQHALPKIKLTASELKAVCTQIAELEIRDDRSIEAVLEAAGWPSVNQANPRARGQALRAALARLRYPMLTRADDKYGAAARALKLPSDAELQHAPNFEDDAVTLRARLPNADAAKALAEQLLRTHADGRLDRLFKAAALE